MHPEFERVREDFSAEKLDKARVLTWEAVHAIAKQMHPGLLECDAKVMAEQILKDKGAERFWHKTHVRFGVNTLKTFSETSLPGVRLQERDMFFIDIGPVWDGYEGDAGASFVLGEDPQMRQCQIDSKEVFEAIRSRWQATQETGKELYKFAFQIAEEKGWQFLLAGASGHRISDFPHRLYHQGSLHDLAVHPAAERWILEVHLRHPKRSFGAFYEDLLT